MTTYEQVQRLLPDLDQADKLRLLARTIGELTRSWLSPGAITSDPRICGGEARIRHTRIPVWTLARYRQLGLTDDEILTAFPSINRAQFNAAMRHAATHSAETADAIRANEDA